MDSWRKESSCSLNTSPISSDSRVEELYMSPRNVYPFAYALRIRVIQIVCGIIGLVMGSVACLEERKKLGLCLGVPAGAVTVLAGASSIYYSRGFGGYSASTGGLEHWGPPWRALGPTPRAALPLGALWASACALHATLIVLAFSVLTASLPNGASFTMWCVAVAQLVLSGATLVAALLAARLDILYDAT